MNKFAGPIRNLLLPTATELKNYLMNGYYASGANPYHHYGQNENFPNGMTYYMSPQQSNPQHGQNFTQSAPLFAFVPQPVPYGGYNQHQYAPPPQYQEQQLYQHNQNELPDFEQVQQSSNNNEKLCAPCRTIIKKRLIPVLHELGCLDQLDFNGMSDQCATEAIDTEEDKYTDHELETTNSNKNNVDGEIQPSNATAASHQPVETEDFHENLPATLATEAARHQSNEEMEVGTGVLEAATQDFVPQPPEGTVDQDTVEEQEDQQIVLHELAEMETSNPSKTNVIDAAVEEPEFDINEIEFGYTPDPSVETSSSSPGMSVEEVVAFNENEYVEEFPSLAHMNSENAVETFIISKTLKKKLKKEKSIEKKEQTAERHETAAPPAARKHQRKPKRFITQSDLCASSDAPTIQFSTSHNSHKMQSKRARSSSRGRGMGCRASKTNEKKPPCFPVTINSNIFKPAVKADLYVPVPPQKDTTVENGMKYLNFPGQRYMSKAERRQLNGEKAQRQQQATSKIMPLELTSLPRQFNAINDGEQSEKCPSLLTSENKSDVVNSLSVNSQELEFEGNQDTQVFHKSEEASAENWTPDVRNLGENQPVNDQPPLMYESKADQVEVLSAKDRKLIFNSNLRLQKKTRKSVTENTEGEPSNVPPPANPKTSTSWTEKTTTSNSTMNNIESTSSAPMLPLSTKDDIPDCKHMELDVSQEMRMYWNAIKKCRYAYLAFNIPNVALDLFKDDTTNLGMQILQKLQQNPAVDCRLRYYNKNHSVLWQMRMLAFQQVKNDHGRTMKLFELCQSEQNNINVQDIAALNSLGLSDEHVNRCYPAMVSAIAKTYARREYGTYEITPEYIKKHVETGFDDKYLVHFCNYINRQLRRRYFNDGIAEKNRRETLLSEISQVCDDGSELLKCNTQRCKTAFRGMSQVLKKKGFKEAANLLDFLRKINS